VRARVVALAAERLGTLAPEQVPGPLRPFARFTPGKRARLAAGPLAAALESDPVFRQYVADGLRETLPELTAALTEGAPLPEVRPEDVAAAAYVLRTDGWRERIERAAVELAARDQAASGAAGVDALRRLTEQLEALRSSARSEADRLRSDADSARAEVLLLRRRVREVGDRVGRAEAAQRAAEQALALARSSLEDDRAQAQDQVRRLQAKVADAERAAAAGRQTARESRTSDELRLKVLLDALVGAAAGLRRELALAPMDGRPADTLSATYGARTPTGLPPSRGRSSDDPALLDALLSVPLVHLLVDGYNVTKTGYGELPLEAQRRRLLTGLGALAARTAAEVTVVFDGTEHVNVQAAHCPRGVRLLFSREGESADEVLRQLVRHEPGGRQLVVVSSDREVAEGVITSGARAVPSLALLRLLGR